MQPDNIRPAARIPSFTLSDMAYFQLKRIFQVSHQRSQYAPDATVPLNLLLSISDIIPALRRLCRAVGGQCDFFAASLAGIGKPLQLAAGRETDAEHGVKAVRRARTVRTPTSLSVVATFLAPAYQQVSGDRDR